MRGSVQPSINPERSQSCHPQPLLAGTHLCNVARPMTRSASRVSHHMKSTFRLALVLCAISVGVFANTGCSKLDARRLNTDGTRLHKDGKFLAATEKFEAALAKQDLPQIHYNAALSYIKLFMVGCDPQKDKDETGKLRCPDNAKYADKAAEHLGIWIKFNPADKASRDRMTRVWLDNNQFDKAVGYWQELLAQDPKNPEIMGKLAGINFKARRWRETMDWYNKQAEVTTGDNARTAAYQSMGNVAWAFLSNRDKMVWEERIECADRGIGALESAAKLNPKKPEISGMLAALYNFRAIAHGPFWAGAIDRASGKIQSDRRRVLADEAKKAAGEVVPSTPGATPGPAQPKSGG